MSESFSFQRLSALFTRYWAQKKKTQSLLLVFAVLIIALLMYLINYNFSLSSMKYDSMTKAYHYSLQVNYLLFFLVVAFYFFSYVQMSQVFSEFSDKRKERFLLLIPASKLEKFIYLFLNAILIPFVFFWGMAWMIAKVMSAWVFAHSYNALSYFETLGGVALFHAFFLYFLVFVGFFVWKKNQLLFSILVSFLVFGLGAILLNMFLLWSLMDRVLYGFDFGGSNIPGYHQSYRICNGLIADFPQIATPVMICFFVGMFYFAYLRFKEKQFKS